MIIDIEPHSGFCAGVKRVVNLAEDELNEGKKLQCLGEIVHNTAEVERLTHSGMNTIGQEEIGNISDSDILIRAHGEPPSTYKKLMGGNNRIIDGTCPVVLHVQKKVKDAYNKAIQENGKVIIYGKATHPEVIGLLGQINNDGLAVTSLEELASTDFSKPVYLFSQTTMPAEGYKELGVYIRKRMNAFFAPREEPLHIFDTICRQVSNRVPQLREFAGKYDVIIFVGGAKKLQW
ncbi:MAG: 4-hydroxy-3-methylbut-2-enyl diphosphate reductase [Bacteroidales bacterium]|nr:4-hydroxy-3-methylbut-2-enyl diphosphate reductase [Bacteroidales bacterium]